MKNIRGKQACPKCGREVKSYEEFRNLFAKSLGRRESTYKCGGCGHLFEG